MLNWNTRKCNSRQILYFREYFLLCFGILVKFGINECWLKWDQHTFEIHFCINHTMIPNCYSALDITLIKSQITIIIPQSHRWLERNFHPQTKAYSEMYFSANVTTVFHISLSGALLKHNTEWFLSSLWVWSLGLK